MKDIFDRIFNLIKKTGDKVIIINSDNDDSYAVMTLRDYEKMAMGEISEKREPDLTDPEPQDKIDKINSEIAAWQEQEKQKDGVLPPVGEKNKTDETSESQFYFEPVE